MKTTVMVIKPWWWTEKDPEAVFSLILDATRAVAIRVALCCHMDIMSISHAPLPEEGFYETTVVYVNNGVSFEDIRRAMRPEMNNNPPQYWMIQDIYEELEGSLDCIVAIKGAKEKWS